MADFYQVPVDLPKTSPEYLRWEKLNFILRQIYEMVGNLDGRLGPIGFVNKLDMGGYKITDGPLMTSAKDTDFVTKSWFKSAEFGQLAVSLLSSTGKTPLPITGSVGTSSTSGGGSGGAVSTTAPITGGGVPPITIAIAQASGAVDGYLSAGDWTIFNSKQAALSFGNLTELTSAVLTIGGGTGAVIGAGTTITVAQAAGASAGYLSAADWTTFNAKVPPARTISTTAPLTGGGDLSIDRTLAITQAGASSNGYLSSVDWLMFAAKGGGLTTISAPATITFLGQFWRQTSRISSLYTTTINSPADTVTFASAVGSATAAGQYPFSGLVSRFILEPDDTGVLQFVIRIDAATFNMGTAGASSGDGNIIGAGIITPGRLLLAGIGRQGFTNANPRAATFVNQTAYDLGEYSAPTNVWSADKIATTSWDVKWHMVYDATGGVGLIDISVSIDGAAYVALGAVTPCHLKSVYPIGLRVVMGIISNNVLLNFSGTVLSFTLDNGYAYWG